MLVYFSVDNFRSISDSIELNLKAAPRLRRLKSHARSPIDTNKKLRVLKGSVLYGANASGKSNIIKAIAYAKKLISGDIELDYCDVIRSSYFLLSPKDKTDRSFTFEFTVGGSYFAYFLKTNNKIVLEEELALITQSSEVQVFYRKFDDDSYSYHSDFISNKYTDLNDKEIESAHTEFSFLTKYTPKNKPFLSEIAEKLFDSLKDSEIKNSPLRYFFVHISQAFCFFKFSLITIFPETKYSGSLPELRSGRAKYLNLISKFDTGITTLTEVNVPLSEFSDDVLEDIEKKIKKTGQLYSFKVKDVEHLAEIDSEDNSLKITKLASIHKNKSKSVQFDIIDESDGTRRLLDLIPALENTDEETNDGFGHTFIIDEFDRSLHPIISYRFLESFLSQNNNDQIIATTHEAELLDNNLLRRDEIWFTQKEKDGSTHLYSLNDYTTRYDKDIHSAYLKGVFGGIPSIVKRFK
ncbi:ATP/GTP-binding protein [Pseudoalteromonas prydzensis]|uniref:AAA family ATPase n=1 Tax=Pseudoalteromonas prydzensis TaxID=182141 RepID=UPI003704ADF1